MFDEYFYIPDEIILKILNFLVVSDLKSLAAFAIVCKRAKQLSYDSSLWASTLKVPSKDARSSFFDFFKYPERRKDVYLEFDNIGRKYAENLRLLEQEITNLNVSSANYEKIRRLQNPYIRQLILKDKLSIDEAKKLSPPHFCILTTKEIVDFILANKLNAKQAWALTECQFDLLLNPAFEKLINNGILKIEQILNLKVGEINFLMAKPEGFKEFKKGNLTLEEFLPQANSKRRKFN